MDDTLKKLGSVRAKDEGRDAIHIAVLTMEAQDVINVRGVVYVEKDGQVCSVDNSEVVGILDPFLPMGTRLKRGDWFYVYLRPGSISGLAHVWSHPLLDSAPEAYEEPAGALTEVGRAIANAKLRVIEFVESSDFSLDYEGFIELFETGSCGHFSLDGRSIYSGDEEISSEVPVAIVVDVETIIGRALDLGEEPLYFRCAC